MPTNPVIEVVDRQTWLDKPAKVVQEAVHKVYDALGGAGSKIKDVMHGTWLGHPLHPVLTDLPIGAWGATLLLDSLGVAGGRKGLERAADATLALGVLAALPTAAAGITDWHVFRGREVRRVGLLHAIINTSALTLQATSLVLRRGGLRPVGQGLSLLALTTLTAGAYLGGHLAYGMQVGTDQNAKLKLPAQFVPVLADSDLPEGELRKVMARDVPVLLYRKDGQIQAMVETCAHWAGPLAKGHVHDDAVVCPWHYSEFALESGQVLRGPSAYSQPCFETRVVDGQIEVKASS